MDKISLEARSRNMSLIKSRNTKPELTLRKLLYKDGFRYRINFHLLGKPDIVFPSKKIVIFVNGCFWHGHKCKNDHKPKTNSLFWANKIKKNIERDKKVKNELEDNGWKVLVVWECDLETNRLSRTMSILRRSFEAKLTL